MTKKLTNTIRLASLAIQLILSDISPKRLCAIYGAFTQCIKIVDMEVKVELSETLPSSSSSASCQAGDAAKMEGE